MSSQPADNRQRLVHRSQLWESGGARPHGGGEQRRKGFSNMKIAKLLMVLVGLGSATMASGYSTPTGYGVICANRPNQTLEGCRDCCADHAESNDCAIGGDDRLAGCAALTVQAWTHCLYVCDYNLNKPVCDGTTC